MESMCSAHRIIEMQGSRQPYRLGVFHGNNVFPSRLANRILRKSQSPLIRRIVEERKEKNLQYVANCSVQEAQSSYP